MQMVRYRRWAVVRCRFYLWLFLGDGGPDLSSQLMMVGVRRWMAIFKGYTDLLTCCCITRVLRTRFDWSFRDSAGSILLSTIQSLWITCSPPPLRCMEDYLGRRRDKKWTRNLTHLEVNSRQLGIRRLFPVVYPQCPALQPLKHLSTLFNVFLTLELVVCPLWEHILLNILHCHNHEIRFKKRKLLA